MTATELLAVQRYKDEKDISWLMFGILSAAKSNYDNYSIRNLGLLARWNLQC